MKPKQGLKYLQEKDLVGTSPEDIAAFFHREDRLDKTVVGDYMGDGDEWVALFNRMFDENRLGHQLKLYHL